MSPLERLSKWLQLKVYQLEVTYGVSIYTPAEKFLFYSILFLLISLTIIATVLYAPQHVQFIISRAWFYMHGDSADASAIIEAAKQTLLGGGGGGSSGTAGVLKEL